MVKRPFAPSLDRIDSTRGYVVGNVQFVCTAANFAKGQWGLDVLRRIARGVVATERTLEREWYSSRALRLVEATQMRIGLSGRAGQRQDRIIAGLKASLSKGPSGEKGAAKRARQSRKAKISKTTGAVEHSEF